MAVVEKVSLVLTGTETLVSGDRIYKKGEIYSVTKEEAVKLLSIKGDYDLRFFKKHEGEVGVKKVAQDVEAKAVLPTQEEIASDMLEDAIQNTAKAIALDKADAAATESRGTVTVDAAVVAEAVAAEVTATIATGEMDTAITHQPKTRGKGVAV